jgi:hypothetical protein
VLQDKIIHLEERIKKWNRPIMTQKISTFRDLS